MSERTEIEVERPLATESPLLAELGKTLEKHLNSRETFAVEAVNSLIETAEKLGASDLHLVPESRDGMLVSRFRINGVLQPGPRVPLAANVISRLKVISGLLTYRTDVPQEGRVKSRGTQLQKDVSEIRVSTFPTLHGEKAVVRFFIGSEEFRFVRDLGLSDDVTSGIEQSLGETSGLFLICGPAGSGKTTTAYALLRELQNTAYGIRNICTLEDPVEAEIAGISQSQVKIDSGLTYQLGLRSLMRQDPDVIFVGEIRDRETAEIVFQAALTGHLVLSTFHAASVAEAISRLTDMDVEPYVLRSALMGVLAQRLLRRICQCMQNRQEACPECNGLGYSGRFAIAEFLRPQSASISREILDRSDAREINAAALKSGMISLVQRALSAVEQGETTLSECARVLGPCVFSNDNAPTISPDP
ncbi:GspE/PulE family protein [Thalassoglobus sp. JC818]|uniref:GspE/PulE family protein n=1 Tax=Thalassoglobus sp. JC818 TaxID=3232136 RepID=UPI0034575A11